MTATVHKIHGDGLVEFVDEVCGIYFRSILIQKGKRVPQHVHDYDHPTLVCSGKAALYVGGILAGIYGPGQAAPVMAGQHHDFEALENNTRLTCIHHAASADSIKVKGL